MSSLTNGVNAAEGAKVLRVKGLIVEDLEGRARIILGAPTPEVPERLRKDGGTDLIFLDGQGHDRFRVGEVLPAVSGFHRIGSAYGATILDTQGGERGGLGFLSTARILIGPLLRWTAITTTQSLQMSGQRWWTTQAALRAPATCIPGKEHDQEGSRIGTIGDKAVISFKDRNDKKRASFALEGGRPSFQVFDEEGKLGQDLLNSPPSGPSERH